MILSRKIKQNFKIKLTQNYLTLVQEESIP